MVQGQILNTKAMGNQQLRPKGKVQRLSFLRGVHYKLLVVEVGSPLTCNGEGEDIVCAYVKA